MRYLGFVFNTAPSLQSLCTVILDPVSRTPGIFPRYNSGTHFTLSSQGHIISVQFKLFFFHAFLENIRPLHWRKIIYCIAPRIFTMRRYAMSSRARSLLKECPVQRVSGLPHSSLLFITIAFNTVDAILWFWSRNWLRPMCDMSNKEIIKMRLFFGFDQQIKVYTMCIIFLQKSNARWNFSNFALCMDFKLTFNWEKWYNWIEIFSKEKMIQGKNDTNKKIRVFIIEVTHNKIT